MTILIWIWLGAIVLYFITGAACHVLDAIQKGYRNKAYKKQLRDAGYLE